MPMNPRLLRPTPTGFDPRRIAGLQLWLDAADSSTITTSTGVSEWRDKSSRGSKWAQATANNQPATGTQSMNGKNVLVFDGTNDALTSLEPLATSMPMTMFIVHRIVTKTDFGMTYAAAGYNYIGQSSTTGKILWSFGGGTFAEGLTDASGTNVIATCVMPASGSGDAFINGGTRVGGNTNRPTLTGTHYLGRFQFGNNGNVWIAEILSYTAALLSSERQKVESYLGKKWGITVT
jgi:hypothetical protein